MFFESSNIVYTSSYFFLPNKTCESKPLSSEKIIKSLGIHMRYIHDGQCRSIIGEPKNMMCCGKPSNGSWCEAHKKIYFVDAVKKVNVWY